MKGSTIVLVLFMKMYVCGGFFAQHAYSINYSNKMSDKWVVEVLKWLCERK